MKYFVSGTLLFVMSVVWVCSIFLASSSRWRAMTEPRFDPSEPSRRSFSTARVMTLLSVSTVSRDGQTRVRASILRLNRYPRLQHVPACRTLSQARR